MKNTTWTASVLLAGLLAFGGIGCKKKAAAQQVTPLESGVQKFREALTKASPEVQSNFYSGLEYNVRYENYLQALVFADRIANDPSLNPQQKRLGSNVIELLKARLQEQPQKR